MLYNDIMCVILCVCVFQGLLFLILVHVARTFYVPGVAPMNFHENDMVEIKVRIAYFITSCIHKKAGRYTKNQYGC